MFTNQTFTSGTWNQYTSAPFTIASGGSYTIIISTINTNNTDSTIGFTGVSLITTDGALNVVSGNVSMNSKLFINSNTIVIRTNPANNNLALGYGTLAANTSGSANTAFGHSALQANTIGQQNTGLGSNSLVSDTTGSYNTGFGAGSLYYNTTGSFNTGLGYNTGPANGSGAFNNSTAIGYNAQYNASNQIVIGTTSETTVIPGLPTNNYYYRTAAGTQSVATNTSTKVLFATSNVSGNTGLSYNSSTGEFTNTNAYTMTLIVSYTTAFASLNSGVRISYISRNATGERLGYCITNAVTTTDTATSGSAIITLASNNYIYCQVFNTASANTLIAQTNITILTL